MKPAGPHKDSFVLQIAAVAFLVGAVCLVILLVGSLGSDDPDPEPTRYRVAYSSCSDEDALILDESTGAQLACQTRILGVATAGGRVTTVFTDEETDRVVGLAKRLAQAGTPFGGEPKRQGLHKAEKQQIESLLDEIRRSHGETAPSRSNRTAALSRRSSSGSS